jgi:hypothetical protein
MRHLPALVVVALLVACRAVVPAVDLAECIWNSYKAEPAGTPMPKVVTDAIAACGGDAGTVISTLDSKESPAIHASVAHGSP